MTQLQELKLLLSQRHFTSQLMDNLHDSEDFLLEILRGVPLSDFMTYLRAKSIPRDKFPRVLITADFLAIPDHVTVGKLP